MGRVEVRVNLLWVDNSIVWEDILSPCPVDLTLRRLGRYRPTSSLTPDRRRVHIMADQKNNPNLPPSYVAYTCTQTHSTWIHTLAPRPGPTRGPIRFYGVTELSVVLRRSRGGRAWCEERDWSQEEGGELGRKGPHMRRGKCGTKLETHGTRQHDGGKKDRKEKKDEDNIVGQ